MFQTMVGIQCENNLAEHVLRTVILSSMKLLAANHLFSSFCDNSFCDHSANSLFSIVLLFNMEPPMILRASENQNKLF